MKCMCTEHRDIQHPLIYLKFSISWTYHTTSEHTRCNACSIPQFGCFAGADGVEQSQCSGSGLLCTSCPKFFNETKSSSSASSNSEPELLNEILNCVAAEDTEFFRRHRDHIRWSHFKSFDDNFARDATDEELCQAYLESEYGDDGGEESLKTAMASVFLEFRTRYLSIPQFLIHVFCLDVLSGATGCLFQSALCVNY